MNNRRQNPILQLLLIIGNIKTTDFYSNLTLPLVIFYCRKDRIILLNGWENLYYFKFAFFYLFLNRLESHLEKQKQLMLVKT